MRVSEWVFGKSGVEKRPPAPTPTKPDDNLITLHPADKLDQRIAKAFRYGGLVNAGSLKDAMFFIFTQYQDLDREWEAQQAAHLVFKSRRAG